MSDFWVGNFRVDVSRAQIVVKDDIVSLEPRVLKVLLTLAETPGEVVLMKPYLKVFGLMLLLHLMLYSVALAS